MIFNPMGLAKPNWEGNDLASIDACAPEGRWFQPATGKLINTPDIVQQLAAKPVVLLGESHDNFEHHRWQLQMLATLHGANPNMVIAFEMFPRRIQPVLNRWIRGEYTTEQFLEAAEWEQVWGIATEAYLWLFHFARMNHIPMIAMNVDRSVVSQVSRQGLASLNEETRQGVSNPARPPQAYIDFLAEVFGKHATKVERAEAETETDAETSNSSDAEANGSDSTEAANSGEANDEGDIRETAAFQNFVDAQAFWDRAMAEAIFNVREAGGEPLVVGIVGRGHLQFGHGIPFQLDDMGLTGSSVLLPSGDGFDCDNLKDNEGRYIADLVFGLSPRSVDVSAHGGRGFHSPHGQRLRLGVVIDRAETGGVRIERVVDGSVAEQTGLKADDVIVSAAGRSLNDPATLVMTVRRQAPGTWLPMTIRRGDRTFEAVAKFQPAS